MRGYAVLLYMMGMTLIYLLFLTISLFRSCIFMELTMTFLFRSCFDLISGKYISTYRTLKSAVDFGKSALKYSSMLIILLSSLIVDIVIIFSSVLRTITYFLYVIDNKYKWVLNTYSSRGKNNLSFFIQGVDFLRVQYTTCTFMFIFINTLHYQNILLFDYKYYWIYLNLV